MQKFVHYELNTSDPAAAKKFYKGLFGWKMKDMKMGPGAVYTMIDFGDGTGGGLQQHPMPGQPSAWLNYVAVASVKKAMAKAAKLGGTVVVDYMPIPGHGACGIFVNPTGAGCAVWEAGATAAPAKKAAKKAAKKPAKKTAKKGRK